MVVSSPIRVPARCFHASWRSKGPCWINTKIDRIGDIRQLANGLNGANRQYLAHVGAFARMNDIDRRLKLTAKGVNVRARLAVKQREL
jgi:hypothetical protein